MNGRDRWVPALFIYEKDMAPTEMRRASDGSGKQLVRRDGMPSPSDSLSNAATPDEDAGSEDEGRGRKRPMYDSAVQPREIARGRDAVDLPDARTMDRQEILQELAALGLSDPGLQYSDEVLRRQLQLARLGDFQTTITEILEVMPPETDLKFLEESRRRVEEAGSKAEASMARVYGLDWRQRPLPEAWKTWLLEQQMANRMARDREMTLFALLDEAKLREELMAKMMQTLRLQQWTFHELNADPVIPIITFNRTTKEVKSSDSIVRKVNQMKAKVVEMSKWMDPLYDHMFGKTPGPKWYNFAKRPYRWWPEDAEDLRSPWRIFVKMILTGEFEERLKNKKSGQWTMIVRTAAGIPGFITLNEAERVEELARFREDLSYEPRQDLLNWEVLPEGLLGQLLNIAETLEGANMDFLTLYVDKKPSESKNYGFDAPRADKDPATIAKRKEVVAKLREQGTLPGEKKRPSDLRDVNARTDAEMVVQEKTIENNIKKLEDLIQLNSTHIVRLRREEQAGASSEGKSHADLIQDLIAQNEGLWLQKMNWDRLKDGLEWENWGESDSDGDGDDL